MRGANRAITKHDVLQALNLLTPEDRAEVVAFCYALGLDNSRLGHPFAEFVYHEVSAVLNSMYSAAHPNSLTLFERESPRQYKLLIRGSDVVARKVSELVPDATLLQRMAMVRFLARLATDWVAHQKRVATIGQVAEAMIDIELVINHAYPGWLETGRFTQRVLEAVIGKVSCAKEV